MKKTLYFLNGLLLAVLFISCDVNEQFEGLDDAARPTNLTSYNYQLVNADYDEISKSALAIATNNSDTVIATSIKTNKYFSADVDVAIYAPLRLQSLFKYADDGSDILLTFNYFEAYDTTKITNSANKYTLLAADYDAMGTGSGQPGQYDYFSASVKYNFYIPIWLKIKYPYAVAGDIKLIRYLFNANSTSILTKTVFTFDGTNWIEYPSITPQVAKFKQKLGVWKFIDTDILVGLNSNTLIGSNLGDFIPISVEGEAVWSWDVSYKYMKITGYVSGPIYNTNEDWLVSPAFNLIDRTDSVFLTFNHVARYFGDVAGSNTNMKKSCSVWISTTSDGTAINPAEWTELTIPNYPSGANWTFISAGEIKLKDYVGMSNIRIAYKYTSSNADGYAGTWEVKNAYIFEKQD